MRTLAELSKHMRSEERTLVLKPMEGKKALSSTGIVVYRTTDGEPNYKVTIDPFTNLWIFKQNYGILPEKLKQKFTSYGSIMKYAHDYFGKRNLVIEKVLD